MLSEALCARRSFKRYGARGGHSLRVALLLPWGWDGSSWAVPCSATETWNKNVGVVPEDKLHYNGTFSLQSFIIFIVNNHTFNGVLANC